MKKQPFVIFVLTVLPLFALAAPVRAEEVRLHGATTVIDRLINPYMAAVEKATGHNLEIVGNATGKGLVDLVEGRCDASLSAEPLEIALSAAKTAGKEIDGGKLQFRVAMHDEIVFIVHPSNSVSSLTWEQIRDIHTGKIKNWKKVGGKDAPITLFTDTVTGGTRAMIKQVVMGGADFTSSAVILTSVKKVGDMVAADPTGFGGLGKGFVDTSRAKIVQTKKVERPLGFITVGAPTPKVAKVIDAFKAEAKKAGNK
jgi:phosphate transport system substrate-binding protein